MRFCLRCGCVVLTGAVWASLMPSAFAQPLPGPVVPKPRPIVIPGAVTGEVVSIEEGKLKIAPAGKGAAIMITPAAGARLLLNGKAVVITDLKPGDNVRVVMSKSADVAIDIRAVRVAPGTAKPALPKPPKVYKKPGGIGENRNAGLPALGVAIADSPGQGVMIVRVIPASPADQAGLAAGDFLMAVGNRPVQNPRDVLGVVQRIRIGDPVAVTRWRAGKIQTLRVNPAREVFVPIRPVEGKFLPLTDLIVNTGDAFAPPAAPEPIVAPKPKAPPVDKLLEQNQAIQKELDALRKEFIELKKRLQ